jgi:hypothetical protein
MNNSEQQLHSIVINSSRGTHLLRAFSLIDQKKWIEDLHDKTKFALENDFFNMAEVIVCDEENSKSKRFYRVVEDLLNIPMFHQSLSVDHRSLQFTTVTTVPALVEDRSGEFEGQVPPGFTEDTLEFLGLPIPLSPKKDQPSTSMHLIHSMRSMPSMHSMDSITADEDTDTSNSTIDTSEGPNKVISLLNAQSYEDLDNSAIISTRVHFACVNPLDRTLQTTSLHRMYDHDILFTHLLRLSLDILHYKELFRHDLFILPSYQRQVAVYIFVKYLLPILQVQGTTSMSSSAPSPGNNRDSIALQNEIDMKLVAAAVQQLSPKALQCNGFIHDERELVRFVMQAQSVLERNSPPKTRFSAPSVSPYDQLPTAQVISSQAMHDTRLPLSRQPTVGDNSKSPPTPENRLDLLWNIPHSSLLAVYQTLFALRIQSVKLSTLSLTGTTNTDRYFASGAAQHSLESLKQPPAVPQPSSFWSWFSQVPPTTNKEQTTDLRANKSRFTTDDSDVLDNGINYPTVDLFDVIQKELEILLKRTYT